MLDRAAVNVQLDEEDPARAWCTPRVDSPWILTREAGALSLRDARAPRQQALRLSFDDKKARARVAEGRRGLLPRALGYKKPPWRVVDMSGGLGRDAASCALLGMQVTVFERSPLLYALLDDAWRRASPDLQSRLTLRFGEAQPADWQAADAVMYDPMYPTEGKKAAPALALQQLRELVGADEDAEAVFAALRAAPPARLALKRPPRGARVRLADPDLSMRGARVSWDIYMARS